MCKCQSNKQKGLVLTADREATMTGQIMDGSPVAGAAGCRLPVMAVMPRTHTACAKGTALSVKHAFQAASGEIGWGLGTPVGRAARLYGSGIQKHTSWQFFPPP